MLSVVHAPVPLAPGEYTHQRWPPMPSAELVNPTDDLTLTWLTKNLFRDWRHNVETFSSALLSRAVSAADPLNSRDCIFDRRCRTVSCADPPNVPRPVRPRLRCTRGPAGCRGQHLRAAVAAGFPQERTPARSRRSFCRGRTCLSFWELFLFVRSCAGAARVHRPQELREAIVCQELRGCAGLRTCAKPLFARSCAGAPASGAARSHCLPGRCCNSACSGRSSLHLMRGRRAWSLHEGRREWSLLMPSGGSSSS